MTRLEALENIRQLARDHELGAAEILEVLGAGSDTDGDRRSGILVKVLSYVGGIFVFAGLATFIGIQWESINSAGRVIITLGPGVVAFALAALAVRDARYVQAATPLFITAAALVPTGMLVAFKEFGPGGDWRVAVMITAATVGLQFGVAFAAQRRTVQALFTLFFASCFWVTALDKLGLEEELVALTLGAGLTLAGIQVHRSRHAAISPVVFLFGSWSLLWGFFDILEDSPLEVLFLAAGCGMVYLGVVIRSRTLNFTATLAILAYVGYFTGQHFADSIGWPLALIAFGLALIAISALALKIDRRYLRG